VTTAEAPSAAPATRSAPNIPQYATGGYRPDLDGLRAVAVLPVLLYHFGLPGVSGGFVGVDVFFVLSGFFITSILVKDLEADRFSILRFYVRRARRILPALFVLLAAVTIAGWFTLLPQDYADYAASLLATLGFGSNVYFWLYSGYFDTAADLKPLLHTWSLAVEEQFYIFFPPALWLGHRLGRKWLIGGMIGIALISLTLSVWAADHRPAPGFYLAPTRVWELLLGCLLAQRFPTVRSRAAVETASVGGIILILGSVALINANSPFPGWLALFPCLGTGLVIWASLCGGGFGNRLLSWPPLVFIGQISYSLYLWHWPISAYLRYLTGRDPTILEAAGMFAAAVLLATLSWRFVEQPFRSRKSRITGKQLVAYFGGSTIVLATAGVALICAGGVPRRFPPEALRYVVEEPQVIAASCFGLSPREIRAGRACTIGDPGAARITFAIWGDSHANRAALPADRLGAAMGVKGLYLTSGSCPPLLGVEWPQIGCRAFNDAAFERIRRDRVRVVVISALWAYYAEGVPFGRTVSPHYAVDEASAERSLQDNRRVFGAAMERTVASLRAAGANVLIMGPVPEIGWDVPRTLARAHRYGSMRAPLTRAAFEARQGAVLPVLRRLETHPGVTVEWPDRSLCTDLCRVEHEGRLLYLDDNHLSLYGTAILRGGLRRSFAEAANPAASGSR